MDLRHGKVFSKSRIPYCQVNLQQWRRLSSPLYRNLSIGFQHTLMLFLAIFHGYTVHYGLVDLALTIRYPRLNLETYRASEQFFSHVTAYLCCLSNLSANHRHVHIQD